MQTKKFFLRKIIIRIQSKCCWIIKFTVFKILQKYGDVPHREMFNIFNMGIGMVLAVDPTDVATVMKILTEWGEKASVIGKVIPGEKVTLK